MNIYPKLQFLIACAKVNPSQKDINSIRSSMQDLQFGDENWQDLSALAHRHGIFPLFYLALKANTPVVKTKFISPEVMAEFKIQNMTIVRRNMLMTGELLKIINLLKENGIEALAFKGPTLAQMAYGDITLREYGDLDILVKKEDIYRIDVLLKDRGYKRVLDITPVQEEVYMQNAHDLGLYHPQKRIHFEMHWALMNEDYPLQIDLEDIWKHPESVKINQQDIPTFPTSLLLFYLCIHGSKHLWERIEWVKDIDLLICAEEIDWKMIVKEAKKRKFEKMVYLGFFLARHIFDTPLPKHITDRMSEMKVLKVLSDFVLQSWQTPPNAFGRTAAMLRLFPSAKEQLIYLNNILIKPSFNEYWAIDLPKALYWGYYFVRPYMLMNKYLSGRG